MTSKYAHKTVSADILEGDVRGQYVQWCQAGGSYRRGFYEPESGDWRHGDWRNPAPPATDEEDT